MRTVGERLIEGLAARGVEVVFGIPGVHTVELYRGLSNAPVRHVTGRHEQGCVFMADGYARVSGKPGVAFLITGPGLTNGLTGMAQARADSIPLLVVTGVNRRASLGRGLGLLHELPDQQAMVLPLCPTFRVETPADLAPVLDAAWAAMTTGRPGPVHVEVPTDVMPMLCDPLPPPAVLPSPVVADGLQAAAAALNAAGRVVILAGGGAKGADLAALAETLDAPVVQTINARGQMPGHVLAVGASPSLDAVRALIAGADQVLAIGTEFGPTDYDMYVRGGVPDLSGMIRIEIDTAQMDRHPAAVGLRGDAAATVAALLPLLAAKTGDGAGRAAAAMAAARAELAALDARMPGRLAMVEAIRAALPGAIIVGDSTQPVYAANLVYAHDRPGGWFNAATGYGTLGYAPGAAIGAAIAAPGVPVVCLIGDGGLQFTAAELRSAVDAGAGVSFVVWNNGAFNEIADAMSGAGTEVIGCHPSPLKLEPFAAACDLGFQSVGPDPAELAAALKAPQRGPRLIEVRAAGA